jgi:predicted metal-dependent peptidase
MTQPDTNQIIQAAELYMSQAATYMIQHHEFWAARLMKLKKVKDFNCNTMWVDGIHLGYNPHFVYAIVQAEKDKSITPVVLVLIHECWHVALGHHLRIHERDPMDWNIAGDYIINNTLDREYVKRGRLRWPDKKVVEGLIDHTRFAPDESTEQAYAKVHSEKPKPPESEPDDEDDDGDNDNQGEDQGSGGSGEDDQESQQDDGGGNSEGESNDQDQQGDGQGQGESGDQGESQGESQGDSKGDSQGQDQGDSEGGSGGKQGDSEGESKGEGKPQPDYEGMGGVRQIPSRKDPEKPASPAEIAEEEAKWREEITLAKQLDAGRGSMGAALSAQIDDALETVVPWQELLRQFFCEKAKVDYTWSPPNARYDDTGFFMPSVSGETIGKVAFAFDTSGSMLGHTARNNMLCMVKEALECVEIYCNRDDPTMFAIYCDTRVHEPVEEIGPGDEPHPKGGGGTAFAPVFKYIEEHRDDLFGDIVAILYFSDGENWESNEELAAVEPDVPVVWLIGDISSDSGPGYYNKEFNPPFGEVIFINEF